VYIEASYHNAFKDLTEGPDAPFRYMKDVFMMAMVIGYNAPRRLPLEKRQMIFKTSAFTSQEDVPILRAVALGPTGNAQILLDDNEILTIAEEYANGGFATLRRQILDRPGVPLNNLILFLTRATENMIPSSQAAVTSE
jgi:dnd system-associated protein 4